MNNKIIGGIVGVLVVAVAGLWYAVSGKDDDMREGESVVNTPVTTKPEDVNAHYKDGTYTATGAYFSPAGKEEVEVTATLKGDIITSTQFVGKAQNPGSVMAQKKFSEGYTEQVVGKAINEVSLTVVNGSSLTPRGFMDALQKIEDQSRI